MKNTTRGAENEHLTYMQGRAMTEWQSAELRHYFDASEIPPGAYLIFVQGKGGVEPFRRWQFFKAHSCNPVP